MRGLNFDRLLTTNMPSYCGILAATLVCLFLFSPLIVATAQEFAANRTTTRIRTGSPANETSRWNDDDDVVFPRTTSTYFPTPALVGRSSSGGYYHDDDDEQLDGTTLFGIFTASIVFILCCIGLSCFCTCNLSGADKNRAARSPSIVNHPQPFPGGPSSPSSAFTAPPSNDAPAPTPEPTPEQRQREREHQASHLDMVRSMTPNERRQYVASFLKTDKFGCLSESAPPSTANSSRRRSASSSSFKISQSLRRLSSFASAPSDDSFQNCAICLDQFTDGEDICVSQNPECSHQFHLVCAFEWLLKSQECPCCRRDYLTNSANGDKERAPTTISSDSPSLPLPNNEQATTAAPTRRGLTAQEILSRVGSLARFTPSSPSIPRSTTRHGGLTAREMLAGYVTPSERSWTAARADSDIGSSTATNAQNGLTARQMLAGHVVPPPAPPLTRREGSDESDIVVEEHTVGGTSSTSTPAASHNVGGGTRLTAREMLASEVPSPSFQPIFRHGGLTARQMLAGETTALESSYPRARPPFQPHLLEDRNRRDFEPTARSRPLVREQGAAAREMLA